MSHLIAALKRLVCWWKGHTYEPVDGTYTVCPLRCVVRGTWRIVPVAHRLPRFHAVLHNTSSHERLLLFVTGLLCIGFMSNQAVFGSRDDLTPLLWLVPIMAIQVALQISDKGANDAD